jgi:signal peptidase II
VTAASKPSAEPRRHNVTTRERPLPLWIATTVLLLDQVVKMIVRPKLGLYESVPVIPGFFSLTRIHNTGAAFGLLDAIDFPFKAVLLALVQTTALIGLAVYISAIARDQRLTRTGLALVIGGAAGNLIDRVRFGYVLDFFDFYYRGWHFWAFNVADAAISVGVALMVLEMLGMGRYYRVSRTV